MYMPVSYRSVVVINWSYKHCPRSPRSFDECEQRRVAADPQTLSRHGSRIGLHALSSIHTITVYYFHSVRKILY